MEVTNHLSHVVILLCICMVLKLMEKCKKHNSNFFYWACGKLCIIPMSSIFVHTPGHYYGDASSIFMVILLLHIFLQPYKQKWHNLLELFLFFNIVSLLMLTLYNYYGPDSRVIIVQLVLISLSFGYIVIYTAIKIHQQYPLLKMSMFRLTNSVKIDDDDDDVDILSDNFPYPTVVLKNTQLL